MIAHIPDEEPMDAGQRSENNSGRGRRVARGVWLRYLTTGAVLAVTRVALFLWLVHRAISDAQTEVDNFLIRWLYPEFVASIVWNSLVSSYRGAAYYLACGSLVTVGSFVMATPVLLVGWLMERRR